MSLHVDFEFLSGVVTLVWFVAFVALCLWAWSPRRRTDYQAAARLALDDAADRAISRQQGSG